MLYQYYIHAHIQQSIIYIVHSQVYRTLSYRNYEKGHTGLFYSWCNAPACMALCLGKVKVRFHKCLEQC